MIQPDRDTIAAIATAPGKGGVGKPQRIKKKIKLNIK